MLIALLVLAAICLLANLTAIAVLLGLTIVMSRDMRDVLMLEKVNTARITTIDRMVLTLQTLAAAQMTIHRSAPPVPPSYGTGGTDYEVMPPDTMEKFETDDGRHSATNLKDLMDKIEQDPKYNITDPSVPPPAPPDTTGLEDLFRQHMKDVAKPPDFTAEEKMMLNAGELLPCGCTNYSPRAHATDPMVWRCPLHRESGQDGYGKQLPEAPDAQ